MSDTTGVLTSPVAPVAIAPLQRTWRLPDGRSTLQLVLATLWLFDGILQLQAFFFTQPSAGR